MGTMLDGESLRDFSEHAQLTVIKISASASATGIPFIPILGTRQIKPEYPTNRVSTTSSGAERSKLGWWDPGSGVLVVEIPHIVPRAWLHRIHSDTVVTLTEPSKRKLKKVFENRHLVGTDQEFEGRHLLEEKCDKPIQ